MQAKLALVLLILLGVYPQAKSQELSTSVRSKLTAELISLEQKLGFISNSLHCDPPAIKNSIFPNLVNWSSGKCDLKSKFDMDQLCKVASKNCIEMTGNSRCWESETEYRKHPESNTSREMAVSAEAKAIFEGYIGKEELVNHCCGSFKQCRNGFTRTQIVFSENDDATEFIATKNTISLKPSVLSRCLSKGCVSYILLHELGHSCHFWQYHKINTSTGKPNSEFNFSLDAPVDSESTTNDLAKYLGKERAECVRNSVMEYDKKNPSQVSVNSLMEEASADAIFQIYRSTNADDIAIQCQYLGDSRHPASKDFMPCLVDPRTYFNRACKK